MRKGWRKSWKDYLDRHPVPAKAVAEHYGIDGVRLERQCKDPLSGCREWDQLDYADECLLFLEEAEYRRDGDVTRGSLHDREQQVSVQWQGSNSGHRG